MSEIQKLSSGKDRDPLDSFRSEEDEGRPDVKGARSSARMLVLAAGLALIAISVVTVFEKPSPRQVAPAPTVTIFPNHPTPFPSERTPTSTVPAPLPVETAAATKTKKPAIANASIAVGPISRSKNETNLPGLTPVPEAAVAEAPLAQPSFEPSTRESEVASVDPVLEIPVNPSTAASPASSIVDRSSRDRAAIGGVLQAYQSSYNALDAETVSTIWQGLDVRALRRAFSTLSSQDVTFDQCDVKVKTEQAQASCTGTISYVQKIGDGNQHQRRMSWTIDLRRTADRWLIASVSAR